MLQWRTLYAPPRRPATASLPSAKDHRRMRRTLSTYFWPVLIGILLAIVLINAFPERLGRLPVPSMNGDAETVAPAAPATTPVEQQAPQRPAPEVKEAAPLDRQAGP